MKIEGLTNKRVLVTGGAGFLGSHIVPLLLSNENEAVVLDNFSNGRRENLDPVKDHSNLKIIEGDVTEIKDVQEAMKNVEVIIHLAVLDLRQSLKEPLKVNEVIVNGTLNCLMEAAKNNVELFVNLSSSETYGAAVYVPMDEKHPMEPTNPYAAAKIAQDMYVSSFGITYGLPWMTARSFSMYGPNSYWEGIRGEVIPKMIVRAMNKKPLIIYGEGNQTRDFTYVQDVARTVINMAAIPEFQGNVVNVCKGEGTSIRKIAELITNSFALNPDEYILNQPARPGDVLRQCGDNTKLSRYLDVNKFKEIEEGIDSTVEWFKSLPLDPEAMLSQEKTRAWE